MRSIIVEAEEGKQFFAANGAHIKSRTDLLRALEHMEEWTYSHHANSERNDFSIWAKDALADPELGADLLASADRKSAQIAILNNLQKRALEVLR